MKHLISWLISRSQTPVWECLLPSSAWRVNEQNRFIFTFITIKHQAELEGRHSQARAWERGANEGLVTQGVRREMPRHVFSM